MHKNKEMFIDMLINIIAVSMPIAILQLVIYPISP